MVTMSEDEWLASDQPAQMLRFLRGRANDRQRRLFACACCRRIWGLVPGPARRAVELAERFADGRVSAGELLRAYRDAPTGYSTFRGSLEAIRAAECAAMAAAHAVGAARHAARAALCQDTTTWQALPSGNCLTPGELVAQADLLREIVGNPFRPVHVDPVWLRWNEGTILKLARAIHEHRRYEELPILADALEEAGCAEEALLSHCREPEGHVLGCWAVDLLLFV